MKKINHLGILILISFLLFACAPDQTIETKEIKEGIVLNIPLNIVNNAEIFVLNNQNLFYFTDEVNEESCK